MMSLPAGLRVWLVAGTTDMRKGFDGLATLVQTAVAKNPLTGQLCVFRGRRGGRVKMLWWDGQGAVPVLQASGAWPLRVAAGQSGWFTDGAFPWAASQPASAYARPVSLIGGRIPTIKAELSQWLLARLEMSIILMRRGSCRVVENR